MTRSTMTWLALVGVALLAFGFLFTVQLVGIELRGAFANVGAEGPALSLSETVWTPDGIAVLMTLTTAFYPQRYALLTMDAEGGEIISRETLTPDAVPSPDGRYIATAGLDGAEWRITLSAADGSSPRALTEGRSPAWSPDGTQIVFTDNRGGSWQIYVMNTNGSGLRQLTTNGAINDSPAWSPDGRQIAFDSGSGLDLALMVVDVDGSHARRLASGSDPAWSPDGTQIAYVSNHDLSVYVINVECVSLPDGCGSDVHRIYPPFEVQRARCPVVAAGETGVITAEVANTLGRPVTVSVRVDSPARGLNIPRLSLQIIPSESAPIELSAYAAQAVTWNVTAEPPRRYPVSVVAMMDNFETSDECAVVVVGQDELLGLTFAQAQGVSGGSIALGGVLVLPTLGRLVWQKRGLLIAVLLLTGVLGALLLTRLPGH